MRQETERVEPATIQEVKREDVKTEIELEDDEDEPAYRRGDWDEMTRTDKSSRS